MGDGLAPIVHVVTVETAEAVEVQVAAILSFKKGYDFDTLQESLKAEIDEYLSELRRSWGETIPVVRISQVESRILSCLLYTSEKVQEAKN